MSEWTMPRRGDACVACRREFSSGEPLQAFLFAAPEGYVREDYCPTCAPRPERTPIATWTTRRPEPRGKALRAFDREATFAFFERLEDAQEPHQLQLRFVLALLLWRKRALKLERTRDTAAGEAWEFSNPRTGSETVVVRPDLDEHELERLSMQLEALLAGQESGLEHPAAPAEESPDAS